MPRFKIETRETVHGVYHVEADNEWHARALFEQGSVEPPSVFESVDTEVKSVEEDEE